VSARHSSDRIGIRLPGSTRSYTEESRLGIDSAQLTLFVRTNPGNVIAYRPNHPALATFGRDQHGEISLSAGTGKCRGYVGFLSLRRLNAQNQHVLGHPAFVARNRRCDAKSEALLSQQSVSAVSGAKRPDFAALGKMHDVFFFVAGPGNIFLSRS